MDACIFVPTNRSNGGGSIILELVQYAVCQYSAFRASMAAVFISLTGSVILSQFAN